MFIPGTVMEALGRLGYVGTVSDRVRAYAKDRLGTSFSSVDDAFRALASDAGFPDVISYLRNLTFDPTTSERDLFRSLAAAGFPTAKSVLELNFSEDRNYLDGKRYELSSATVNSRNSDGKQSQQ